MVDRLGKQLIGLLEEDARQSSEALAKKLGVSSATIRRRLSRLIQSGVIRIVALSDPRKVGLPLAAIIAFDVAHDKLDDVMQQLTARPEVVWASTTTGRYDIIVSMHFPSTDELYDFMQREVPKLEGIKDSETFVCLRVTKARYVKG